MEYIRNRSSKNNRLWFFAAAAVLFIFIAFLLGIIPGVSLPSFIHSTWAGFSNSDTLYSQYSNTTFYPYGFSQNEGFSITITKGIFLALGLNPLDSLISSFFLFYVIGFFSMVYLSYKLSKSYIITIVVTALFYISLLVTNDQFMVPPVYVGILLIPLNFLMDYMIFLVFKQKSLFFRKETRKRALKIILLLAFSFLVKLLIISTGWYIGVMCAFCSSAFFILIMIFDVRKKEYGNAKIKTINFVIYVFGPWLIAMGLITMIMPTGTSDFAYTLDSFYTSSVDIATLFFPSASQLVAQVIPPINSIIPDGFKLTRNLDTMGYYLGYAAFIAVFVLLIKNKQNKKATWILFSISMLMFILSLGPALKFFELLDSGRNDFAIVSIENAKIVFPWANIYETFPISMMRAVYRWYYMFRAIGFILFAILIGNALHSTKKACRVLVFFICLISILEFLPVNIPATIEEKQNNYSEAAVLLEDTHSELENIIESDSVVAIALGGTDSNKYLAAIMISGLDSHIYAGSGDKADALSSAYAPQDIIKLSQQTNPYEIASQITLVDEKNLADYVVLPYYNMHSSITTWPPSQESIEEQKLIASAVEKCLNNRYEVFHLDYYTIFKLKKSPAGTAYDILSDQTLFSLPAEEPYLGNQIYPFTPDSPLTFNLDASGNNYNHLYGNFYINFSEESDPCLLDLTIKSLDENGDILQTTNQQLTVTPTDASYSFTKFEFDIPLNLKEETQNLEITLSNQENFSLKRLSANLYSSTEILPSFYTGKRLYFSAEDLFVSGNGEVNRLNIELYNGGTQYGPYTDLSPGRYRIIVNGENIDSGNFSIYSVIDGSTILIHPQKDTLSSSSMSGTYEFEITDQDIEKQANILMPSQLSNVEFVTTVTKHVENPVIINNIYLECLEAYDY